MTFPLSNSRAEPIKGRVSVVGSRIAFRFSLVYWILYCFPIPTRLSLCPMWLSAPVDTFWRVVVEWAGRYFLGKTVPWNPGTGSGDTLHDWVRVGCMVGFALLATLIWCVGDRGRYDFPRFRRFLDSYLAWVLALALLGYGFAKVFPSQFVAADEMRLIQPIGQLSPMALAWTFMGHSQAYAWFTGVLEVIAALLLLIRRTRTLGALLAIAVLLNVFLMNLGFDIPVKLGSFHLLLLATYLTLPTVPRLIAAIAGSDAVPPLAANTNMGYLWTPARMRWLKALLGLTTVAVTGISGWQRWMAWNPPGQRHPLQGIYETETFIVNGLPRPPSLEDPIRWRRLLVTRWGGFFIQTMNEKTTLYRGRLHLGSQTLVLQPWYGGTAIPYHLVFVEGGMLQIETTNKDPHLKIRLRMVDLKSFPLVSRPFHWVQEAPLNR